MQRAYAIYVLMFAILAAGLSVVISLGRSLSAPDDLSGYWLVEWAGDPPPGSGAPAMHVTQSGRFFVVKFGERRPMSMVLQEGWKGKRRGRYLDMTLTRAQWNLRLHGLIPVQDRFRVAELQVELLGRTRHFGVARRLTEEDLAPVPEPVPSTQASEPETAHAQ